MPVLRGRHFNWNKNYSQPVLLCSNYIEVFLKKVFTKLNVFIALVVVLAVLTFFAGTESFWSFVNITKIVLVIAASYLLVSWRKPSHDNNQLFSNVLCVLVPLFALASLAVMIISPSLANTLVRESNYLENLQAVCLFLASLIFLVITIRFARQHQKSKAIVAFLFFLAFFVIGMEEISWMEWIVHSHPDTFLQKYNSQDETNLHNINTGLSEDTYYFGSFVFLVLIPFFRKQIGKLLVDKKLTFLETFMPSAWFFLPFTVMTAFGAPYSYKEVTILAGFFVSLAIVVYEIRRYTHLQAWRSVAWTTGLALFLLVTGFFCTFHNTQLEAFRSGAAKEYMENFISLGMFLYAADFYMRNFVRAKARQLKSH